MSVKELDGRDVLDSIEDFVMATNRVAEAITPYDEPGADACGCHVGSLTEAVMGVTEALCRIATSIEYLADAVSNRQ